MVQFKKKQTTKKNLTQPFATLFRIKKYIKFHDIQSYRVRDLEVLSPNIKKHILLFQSVILQLRSLSI